MEYQTGISQVTVEAALRAGDNPEAKVADEEAAKRFRIFSPILYCELIVYHRQGIPLGSPLDFAVIRHIAKRFHV
ncbi:MAG: hypothetical protein A2735_00945 [Candidatus Yanofskybacteria bacterium RIFCSPHIGHO2_01_FULL_41_21]|uniref:Uncharacterized protein n=1 Tax=Candidatus Yanofskybacteria bacterium RIFCSPHIGHO2_01_FULL_41_21 TaxID=1802660 RepID=A0A1F8EAP7_9BACT|nr:MAG: hypothetical protein A2735_00945 [Candidatus Yanofskybacteria bacterium RIFCSPHIGHO2_01_FULL_41_21]